MPPASVVELVTRMRREGWSRNRDFAGFEAEANARRARRVHRWLRSLEQAVTARHEDATLVVEPHPRGRRLTLELPSLRARRVSIVTDEEYALLCEDPIAGELLRRAALGAP